MLYGFISLQQLFKQRQPPTDDFCGGLVKWRNNKPLDLCKHLQKNKKEGRNH